MQNSLLRNLVKTNALTSYQFCSREQFHFIAAFQVWKPFVFMGVAVRRKLY